MLAGPVPRTILGRGDGQEASRAAPSAQLRQGSRGERSPLDHGGMGGQHEGSSGGPTGGHGCRQARRGLPATAGAAAVHG